MVVRTPPPNRAGGAVGDSLITAGIGVAAFFWLWFLSHQLLLLPNPAIADGVNHIFNADVRPRIGQIVGKVGPFHGQTTDRHPWARHIWPVLGAPASRSFEGRGDPLPDVRAARLVMVAIGAAGVVALALLARTFGTPWTVTIVGLGLYLCFTSQAVGAIPEFFGLSGAVLAIGAAVYAARMPMAIKAAALVAVGLISFGTTMTNGLFAALALLWLHPTVAGFAPLAFSRRHARLVGALLAVVAVATLAAGALFYKAFRDRGGWEGFGLEDTPFVQMRPDRLTNPLTYLALGWVYPAVGPDPMFMRNPTNDRRAGRMILTFEPWRVGHYSLWNGIGALAWGALLIACARAALKDPASVAVTRLLMAWVWFNLFFHLVWGDEFFLFSPHWAWALGGVVLLGLRRVDVRLVAALGAMILIGQLATLARVVDAATQIVAAIPPGGPFS